MDTQTISKIAAAHPDTGFVLVLGERWMHQSMKIDGSKYVEEEFRKVCDPNSRRQHVP